MEIIWLGNGCFRLKSRDCTIILDPFAVEPGGNGARSFGEADVVTLSNRDSASGPAAAAVAGQPRLLSGPGEYEVAGALITGVSTYRDNRRGAERGRNTAFTIELEDVKVCHLGGLGHVLTPDQVGALAGADVLLLPVGGHTAIDAAAAAEVISLLEPRLVVPMRYRTDLLGAEFDPLDRFLKQMGIGEPIASAKLTVTHTNLPLETTVAVLEPRRAA